MKPLRPPRPRAILALLSLATLLLVPGVPGSPARALADDPTPPASPVKLIFIHHSCGENWLADDNGGLGLALRDNNYFVSDTNYGWEGGDTDIGNRTDIGHWWEWFSGPNHANICADLYTEYEQHSWYSRLDTDPGGENQIIMFKSCFPNSNLQGSVSDPVPPIGNNPLRGQDSSSEHHTFANAKGIYIDLLNYFATRQDKLFVAVTAPPLQDDTWADNARAFNNWLVHDWLDDYPYKNVAVFDFYNVLTSNGGNWNVNDLGWATGNHHRYRNGAIEHVTNQGGNTAAYPNEGNDDHPSPAGNQKATGEFLPLLNIFYHRWQSGVTPSLTLTAPNGGEVWNAGSQRAITWSSTNLAGNVRLDWSADGFSSVYPIADPLALSGSYTWTVPASPTTSARVRVSSVLTPTLHDDSDANFTITVWSHFLYLPLVTRE